MEMWFIVLVTICLTALVKALFDSLVFTSTTHKKNFPPGPLSFPIVGNLLWLRNSLTDIEPIVKNLVSRYGPMVTLHFGSRPAIFIASHAIAHQALVQNGAAFADRPPAFATSRIISANQHNINTAFYGQTWRFLRRNLTSEILHPSRVRSYSHARKWVLDILLNQLKSRPDGVVRVKDHFQYAMFCLLVYMCFGDGVNDKQIKQVEDVQRTILLTSRRYSVLNFWPKLSKVLFRKRWQEFYEMRKRQSGVLLDLIRARAVGKKEEVKSDDRVVCYADTLLELELPDEKRKLNEQEMVSLCSEFLNAGTDTTSTALEWIIANLIKHPHIQERLVSEIRGVMSSIEEKLEEEDLQKMPYLRAVILEGLRRHPPGHFVLPHSVTEDVVLNGYVIPKRGTVNFMVGAMGVDPEVWEDPLEFKPERFVNNDNGGIGVEGFDITGSREIKMMPFGAGRRMCPGYQLALLHLEYFVANLVWNFEWRPVNREDVDLEERLEFTVVMKNPLQAQITPRMK